MRNDSHLNPQTNRLANHDVAKISDAMGRYGTLRSNIKPLYDEMRIFGPCRTVKPTPGTTAWVNALAESLCEGEVVVADGEELDDFAFADADVYRILKKHGAAGLIVSGAVCDAAAALELGLPVFAIGISLRRIDNLFDASCFDLPLALSGMVVDPGDIVIGDSDGVVFVPQFDSERIADLADAQLAKELNNKHILETGVSARQYYRFEEKMSKWREP